MCGDSCDGASGASDSVIGASDGGDGASGASDSVIGAGDSGDGAIGASDSGDSVIGATCSDSGDGASDSGDGAIGASDDAVITMLVSHVHYLYIHILDSQRPEHFFG